MIVFLQNFLFLVMTHSHKNILSRRRDAEDAEILRQMAFASDGEDTAFVLHEKSD